MNVFCWIQALHDKFMRLYCARLLFVRDNADKVRDW